MVVFPWLTRRGELFLRSDLSINEGVEKLTALGCMILYRKQGLLKGLDILYIVVYNYFIRIEPYETFFDTLVQKER